MPNELWIAYFNFISSSLYRSAFNKKPKAISDVTVIVPPYDINGSGTPTTGKIPITIPIFIKTWKNNMNPTPEAMILPYVYFDLKAIQNMKAVIIRYNEIM